MQDVIYLDYMASTPIDNLVRQTMLKYLDNQTYYGNPAGNHIYGNYAQEIIQTSKTKVADYFNTKAENWVITSGATEAINLAIYGAANAYKHYSKRIITFESEHAATLQCCKNLRNYGFEIEILPVNNSGLIDLNKLETALKTPTLLISLLHVNNEIGVIQPIKAITKLAKQYNCLIHVDGVQTVGKAKIDVENIDLLSISSHKNYGPKGIGALHVNEAIKLSPMIFGGGQERGIRSGTLATHQIAGMGAAYEISKQYFTKDQTHILELYNYFISEIVDKYPVTLNGDKSSRVPHNLSLTFRNFNASTLVAHLHDFAFSLGSACQSGSNRPSHVLMAIGHTHLQANNTIRISLGRFTTKPQITKLITTIKELMDS